MLGFFYCDNCGNTHDNWMHGNKLIVCANCKTKQSLRYNYALNGSTTNREFLGIYISEDVQDLIKNQDLGDNPFDLKSIKKMGSPEFRTYMQKNSDEYLKFAFHDFRSPEDVYKEFMNRDSLGYAGIDVENYK